VIVTVTSQKGGVGKTTTAVNLAAGLARDNIATLLVDLDPQGHDAVSLGCDRESGLFNWLVGEQPLVNCVRIMTEVRTKRLDQLWLLPSDSRTKTLEAVFRSEADGPARVRAGLQGLRAHYPAVVFDTSATGLLQETALAVADIVVMPTRTEALAVDGIEKNLATLHKLRPNFGNYCILPVAYDERLREHRYQLGQLRSSYAGAVLPPVPARTAVAEAQAYGQTIWEYSRDGMAEVTAAYTNLVRLVRGELCSG
jgi:chromosome partitioning protein